METNVAPLKDHKLSADINLFGLSENSYPGRGFVIGMDQTETHLVQVYWIMGRSVDSRNRIFVDCGNGKIKTEAVDPTKVQNPDLIIYTAMDQTRNSFAVSNGRQTEMALSCLNNQFGLASPVFAEQFKYEPDSPNFTPRITAGFSLEGGKIRTEISILKKSPFGSDCIHQLYRYESLMPGFGYSVTTYKSDGNPLPSFTGEPYILPLEGDIETIAKKFWGAFNEENKVSLVVKSINIGTREISIKIINKYSKVEA